MARYIQRPENALKRANEFIDVGKPLRALDTLQEVFRNKKFTYNWSESVIEPLMFKYLYLCVELKKSHIAKEGLFQYRNMIQLVNVNSLENVIRGYLKMAEEHTKAAQQQSSAAVAVLEVDDLDNIATPESILLSAVCGEDAQDRSDRTILLPWVKFLWESYCQCLELLRLNTHCEILYHDIARMAFHFCLKYNRKSEFRRLCDKLRKHLEDVCKGNNQANGVSINKVETQQLCLDTRLYQLDSAIQMELWLEAYKAIEDIHGLMALAKKTPAAKTMANYYQKLAMVFAKAGNQLFHAAALLKLFQLTRELKKNTTEEEMQRMASHVLIATLSIPLPSAHPEFDRFIETDKSPLEKAQRLAVLLGLTQPPTRVSLLKELIRLNVHLYAAEKFKNLYYWLEVDFDPLNLSKRIHNVVKGMEREENSMLTQYIQSLKDVTIMRLIRQISQVYRSIEFTHLIQVTSFSNMFHLEKILVDCVRHNDMQIRIDHQKRCVYFGMDLTESQREDHTDGPSLQSMPSEQIRSQLVKMSNVLHQGVAIVNPNRKKEERQIMRTQMVWHYHEIKEKEHQRVLQRQKIIEERKEYIERLNNAREEEEQKRIEEASRQLRIAEEKRLQQENEEREKKRAMNEIAAIKEKSLKEKVQQISQTTHGKKMLSKLDEEGIKKLDAEQIAARESEELNRERKEMQTKLKSLEKKIDYFERAKRIEEIPLFQKYLTEKQIKDKEFWESQEKHRIQNAITERKISVVQQDRLKRIYPDRDTFLEKLKKERSSLFKDKLKVFKLALDDERQKRITQRIIKRCEQRRLDWLQAKEGERLRKEEINRRAREEEELIEKERRRKDREVEEQKRHLQYEKQRKKEEQMDKIIQDECQILKHKPANDIDKDREPEIWHSRAPEHGEKFDGIDSNERDERAENKEWRRGLGDGGPIYTPVDPPSQIDWRKGRDVDISSKPTFSLSGGGDKWRRNVVEDRRAGDERRDDRFVQTRRYGLREQDTRESGSNWRTLARSSEESRRGVSDRFERGNDRGERPVRSTQKKDSSSWRRTEDEERKERNTRREEKENQEEGEWTSVKRR